MKPITFRNVIKAIDPKLFKNHRILFIQKTGKLIHEYYDNDFDSDKWYVKPHWYPLYKSGEHIGHMESGSEEYNIYCTPDNHHAAIPDDAEIKFLTMDEILDNWTDYIYDTQTFIYIIEECA